MALGFSRVELRTKDMQEARDFYTAVLERQVGPIVPLSQQAAASGAPSHWLGYLTVTEVEAVSQVLTSADAKMLGPTVTQPDGTVNRIFKGPGGAVIGITTATSLVSNESVPLFQLITPEASQVIKSYCDIFGWKLWAATQAGKGMSAQMIGGASDETPSGMVIDAADLPGSHPHWLYHFRVSSLDRAKKMVQTRGGDIVGTYILPSGRACAVCHDPQGAAFAICE